MTLPKILTCLMEVSFKETDILRKHEISKFSSTLACLLSVQKKLILSENGENVGPVFLVTKTFLPVLNWKIFFFLLLEQILSALRLTKNFET